MKDFSGENFVMMPVPASMFAAVCAVLGGAAMSASVATAKASEPRGSTAAEAAAGKAGAVAPVDAGKPADAPVAGAASGGAGAGGASGDLPAGVSADETDAGGHKWDAAMHASTGSKTKEGLWRMKVGVSRPDPLPGSPAAAGAAPAAGNGGTGTASDGAGSTASGTVAPAGAGAADDDDEFAAFAAAAAKSSATDAAAAGSVPARKWTEADMSKLTNQAAVKLGDPAPIKELIASFVTEGSVAHSRNIPEDKREDFAKAVEAKAGITFEG